MSWLSVTMPVLASGQVDGISQSEAISDLSERETWLVQTDLPTDSAASTDSIEAPTEVSEITDIQISAAETGITLTVVSLNPLSVENTQVSGNALIITLPEATLNLSDAAAADQFAPAEGIALVQTTARADNSIQIAITGTDAPPDVQVGVVGENLVLSVVPGMAPSANAEDAIQLTVIGDQDEGYSPNSASVGTRTDTLLLDVPASIQVIPEAVIADQGALDLLDVLRNTPGINTNSSPRDIFSDFTIRGFNTGNTFLRNGVADNDLGRTGLDLSNVERVEVLRGPASVLYGQIAPGGAVNVVTKKPLSVPFYDVEVTYGSFDTYQGAVDLSGPLTEDGSVAYRLNASAYSTDTFIDEIGLERYFVAPVLSWDISDDTNLIFEAEYIDARYPNERGLPIEGTILPNPNGELPRSRYLGEPSFDRNDRTTLRLGYELEHRFGEDWRLQNTFRFSWEEDYQDSVGPGSLEADFRTQPRTAFITSPGAGYSFAQNSYEATLAAIGEFKALGAEHELIMGVDFAYEVGISPFYLQQEIGSIDIFNPVYNQPLGEITDVFDPSRDTATSIGGYVQDQITLSDEFILLLGGRVDYVNQSSLDVLNDDRSSQSDTAFSPRVGLVYQPTEDVSVYGSFGRSFEQAAGRSLDGELFDPSRGTQYEIGAKANWLNDRLSTTLSLYNLTRTNVLTTDPRNVDFEVQTGEQRSRGIELNVAGEILPGWEVIAGYAYTDAEVTEDNDIPVGNQLINVAENTANVWTRYTLQSGDFEGLGFGLGLFYVGSRPGDRENTFDVPSYLRTDAAVYYNRDSFRAQLNFKNLFDTRYFESANGRDRIFPGSPFEVLATVGWEF
ncbi:TonB-dependent siderophore receptor [Synechococcus sp. PCC 7335]|uniref:TonB-dependent siderophore receptor n=1 Tax=Synechococcus sp. (strain ATCC 29403 / PCC 7335) TaxID=91464 RepID=UPI0005716940|nr:TonB-dependent siderophore receptor [Synechococcus sp. PCC 7335]